MKIVLTSVQRDELRRSARAAYPDECCGLIGGVYETDLVRVGFVVPVINSADDPRLSYYMNEKDMIRAYYEIERAGYELIGIYHSHPDDPAVLSQTDRALATWRDLIYVVVGEVNTNPHITAWQITGSTALAVEIVTAE